MDKFLQDVSNKLWKLYLTHIPSHPTTRSLWWLPLHMCPLFLNHQFCRYLQPGCRRYQRYHCWAPALTIACHLVRRHRVPESLGNLGDIATWYDALVRALLPTPGCHTWCSIQGLSSSGTKFICYLWIEKNGYNFTFKRILNALIFLFLSCGHEKLFFSSLERLTSWMHERLATAYYRTLFSKFFPCYLAMAKVNASAQNLLSKYHVLLCSNSQEANFKM